MSKSELTKSEKFFVEEEAALERYLEYLPEKKRARIVGAAMRTGTYAAAPATCPGPKKCLWVQHCPIPERKPDGKVVHGPIEDYPVGRQCILEALYMHQQMFDYIRHLDVNTDNPVEMSIVRELALIDLYKNRAMMVLSSGDRDAQGQDFMRVDIIGYTENGTPMQNSKLHPVAEFIDKLEKRREKWLDKLMQTRKAQWEMAAKLGQSEISTRLVEEMQSIREQLENLKEKPVAYLSDEEILLDD